MVFSKGNLEILARPQFPISFTYNPLTTRFIESWFIRRHFANYIF